jgi:uncharacterized protein YdaU (DUF1376 family)
VNYYEHHIRDYDAATAHLSWDQDMAYARLLRWYYRKERALPADVSEACRQIRATTKAQREAVESVLREFFELREDGWHKDVCDEAIERFKAGEPERVAKRKNEDTRLSRHRAERAQLFGVINAAGFHLPYNAPISEVRALVERISNGTATPATLPATGTATPETHLQRLPISQSPSPRHQTPDTSTRTDSERARPATPESGEGNREPPPPHVPTRTHAFGQQSADDSSGLDAWRDVGCDPRAMESWLDHRDRSGKGLPGHARIFAAKVLLGMGDPETQRAAVQIAIANNWQSIRVADGQQLGGAKGAPAKRMRTAHEIAAAYPEDAA